VVGVTVGGARVVVGVGVVVGGRVTVVVLGVRTVVWGATVVDVDGVLLPDPLLLATTAMMMTAAMTTAATAAAIHLPRLFF
jgi:hypothetical protein